MGQDVYNVKQDIICNLMVIARFAILQDVSYVLLQVQVVYLVKICITKMEQHVLFVILWTLVALLVQLSIVVCFVKLDTT
jgi:hypothetical protein